MMVVTNYIKWLATTFIVSATYFRALDNHTVDLWLSFIGCLLWVFVAYKMKEISLILINVVCLFFLVYGLL